MIINIDQQINMTKNRHAIELSKLGASKGGKAYVLNHSPEERAEQARKASLARWNRHRELTNKT
jgi:hypothetical protein